MANSAENVSVLVIDEDAATLALIAGICAGNGIRALLARTPDEAVEIAERRFVPIDLILADEFLPGAGGQETVARIRRIRPDVRAMYMSAGLDTDVIRIDLRRHGQPEAVTEGGLVESIRAACARPLVRTNGSPDFA